MRLTIDGQPAVLFFRYSRSDRDKFGQLRSDVVETIQKAKPDTVTQAVDALPPNITECYIVMSDKTPSSAQLAKKEVSVRAYGRTHRRPSEAYNPELARYYALTSALASAFGRNARRELWLYYRKRKALQELARVTKKHGLEQTMVWNVDTSKDKIVVPAKPSRAPWKQVKAGHEGAVESGVEG